MRKFQHEMGFSPQLLLQAIGRTGIIHERMRRNGKFTGIKFHTVPYAVSYVVFSGNSEISSNLKGFIFLAPFICSFFLALNACKPEWHVYNPSTLVISTKRNKKQLFIGSLTVTVNRLRQQLHSSHCRERTPGLYFCRLLQSKFCLIWSSNIMNVIISEF